MHHMKKVRQKENNGLPLSMLFSQISDIMGEKDRKAWRATFLKPSYTKLKSKH